MITRIVKGAAATTCGLLMAAMPMVATSAQAQSSSAGSDATPSYTYEWNNAVKSAAPSGTDLYCATTTGAKVCFKRGGDVIYVQDTKPDGASAVMRWYTDYGRWGTCRNALKAGTWGKCNKNFAEDHYLYFRATRYNGDTGKWVDPESSLHYSYTSD